jgi:hypothetical protein
MTASAPPSVVSTSSTAQKPADLPVPDAVGDAREALAQIGILADPPRAVDAAEQATISVPSSE